MFGKYICLLCGRSYSSFKFEVKKGYSLKLCNGKYVVIDIHENFRLWIRECETKKCLLARESIRMLWEN